MLFRIDYERFLTHAIDHFTEEELLSFQYVILGSIPNGAKCLNVAKVNDLYPNTEIQAAYIEGIDKSVLKKIYFRQLDEYRNLIYMMILAPIITKHFNTVIICYKNENDYVDILVEYLKEKFSLDCIDLNELFSKGRVGAIYIDRKELYNNIVDIRIDVAKERYKSLSSTSEGRLKLLDMMDAKSKIKKLKELGIHVTKGDIKYLDKMLKEAWVED